MNRNSPELQAAYDELTAAIEKLDAALDSDPANGRQTIAEYVVVYRCDLIGDDGSHVSGNGVMVRNGYVPLTHVSGLADYLRICTNRRIAANIGDK